MLRKVWCAVVVAVMLLGGASLPAEVDAASARGSDSEVKIVKGKKGKKGKRGKKNKKTATLSA
jgi:hypothetical protein